MRTFIGNLKHAKHTRESATIGGGIFPPAELGQAAQRIEKMIEALETIASGNSDPEAMVRLADEALKQAQD